MFDATQRLTPKHEADIPNVSTIDWKVSSLTRCALMHDQVVKCTKAKVHTSTQIPSHGWGMCKILQKQIVDGKVKWKIPTESSSSSNGTFSQDLRRWKILPENPKESARSKHLNLNIFEERIIFHDNVLMISMWTQKGNSVSMSFDFRTSQE